VVEGVTVQVDGTVVDDDRGQVRRLAGGGEPHGYGVVRLSDHPDPAGGPRLVSDPLDGVVDVVLFGLRKDRPITERRMTGATGIGVDVGVAVGDVEGDVAGFTVTEGGDRGQVHVVFAVGRHGVQRRERARPGWPVDVGCHEAAVPGGDPYIPLDDDGSLAYLFFQQPGHVYSCPCSLRISRSPADSACGGRGRAAGPWRTCGSVRPPWAVRDARRSPGTCPSRAQPRRQARVRP
jgi:hypothetical protein